MSPSVAHDRSLLIPGTIGRAIHTPIDAPLPVPARRPRDCQSSRTCVRTRRPRQITVGGRATIGGMPRVTLVEHVASDAARSHPTIALTRTEAGDPGGALFANGDRQACEAPRDVARHAIVRDRPPVERHAPRFTSAPMGDRSPRFRDDPISRGAPLALLHLPRRTPTMENGDLPRFPRAFSLFPRPTNARWPRY